MYKEKKMPRKPNKIAVKWLESKDAGKTNRVNIKHVIGQLAEIAVGADIVVRFNVNRGLSSTANFRDTRRCNSTEDSSSSSSSCWLR